MSNPACPTKDELFNPLLYKRIQVVTEEYSPIENTVQKGEPVAFYSGFDEYPIRCLVVDSETPTDIYLRSPDSGPTEPRILDVPKTRYTHLYRPVRDKYNLERLASHVRARDPPPEPEQPWWFSTHYTAPTGQSMARKYMETKRKPKTPMGKVFRNQKITGLIDSYLPPETIITSDTGSNLRGGKRKSRRTKKRRTNRRTSRRRY